MFKKLFRIALLPLGLVIKLFEIAKDGARDIDNKLRFKNAIIDPKCFIDNNTNIGSHCHILCNSIINNCKIASYSYVGRNSLIQNTTIGAYCSIANDVCIGLGTHPKDFFSTSPIFYQVKNTLEVNNSNFDLDFDEYCPIVIGNDVWVGARAIILDGVSISDGAIVAANAVVTRDVPPYAIVAGIPAKIITYRFKQDKIDILLDLKWWDLPIKSIKKKLQKRKLI